MVSTPAMAVVPAKEACLVKSSPLETSPDLSSASGKSLAFEGKQTPASGQGTEQGHTTDASRIPEWVFDLIYIYIYIHINVIYIYIYRYRYRYRYRYL